MPLFTELPAIGTLTGWRRNMIAFICGMMATLALPPFFIIPLLVPSFCGLVWLLNGASSRKRFFLDGWWWGWGFYMSGLYWFCIALLTDADKFAWLIPFALFGLTAVIAIYQGVACLLFSYVRAQGIFRVFLFSVIWVLVEYARGHLFTGFPWNLAGYALTVSDVSIQLASLFGAYGLTWLVVFLSMLPAILGDANISSRRAVRTVGAAYLLFAILLAWGGIRLQTDIALVPDVRLRLVQANIAQHHKWDPALQMQGLREHARLTHSKPLQDTTHIIWPETAVPYVIKEHSELLRMLSLAVPPSASLITGALRAEDKGNDFDIFNSVIMIDGKGDILGQYDKNKLVPFGEFLPFRSLIPPAWATPVGNKDFSHGVGAEKLDWPGLGSVAPLVCYEAIFPGYVQGLETRPQLLLNLTNDAWFGSSSAPYQHLEMSRMRAAEQGVPLIRVANTGISAVIDPLGRIVARTQLNEAAILDTALPEMLPDKTTYNKIGDGWLVILLIASLWGLLFNKWGKIKQN